MGKWAQYRRRGGSLVARDVAEILLASQTAALTGGERVFWTGVGPYVALSFPAGAVSIGGIHQLTRLRTVVHRTSLVGVTLAGAAWPDDSGAPTLPRIGTGAAILDADLPSSAAEVDFPLGFTAPGGLLHIGIVSSAVSASLVGTTSGGFALTNAYRRSQGETTWPADVDSARVWFELWGIPS